MRKLTIDQLDDLYRSYKREVPLSGYRHEMTITEFYNKVWRKRNAKGDKQHERPRLRLPRAPHAREQRPWAS